MVKARFSGAKSHGTVSWFFARRLAIDRLAGAGGAGGPGALADFVGPPGMREDLLRPLRGIQHQERLPGLVGGQGRRGMLPSGCRLLLMIIIVTAIYVSSLLCSVTFL